VTTHTSSTVRTFTRTSAQHVASKITADLRRLQSYYGLPSDEWLGKYRDELCELLAGGHVAAVEYGFRREGRRVLSLLYTVRVDGTLADEHAGGVPARVDITGARWFSFLSYSEAWSRLSDDAKTRVQASLPFIRVSGTAPGDGDGSWQEDRSYASDGTGTRRRVFRPHDRRP
jgi:hypothetical protein